MINTVEFGRHLRKNRVRLNHAVKTIFVLSALNQPKTGHLIGYQWHGFVSLTNEYQAVFVIPGGAKTDVRVRVGWSVVQIQRQHTGVAAIVPIATAKEGPRPTYRPNNRNHYTKMMAILQNVFADISSMDNLAKALKKAMVGKRHNNKAVALNYHFMSELNIIQDELINGSYKPNPYRDRIILEPKVRHIQAPDFRDRIVHHAIHSVLNPFYEQHFIPDSYACRPKRGIHSATRKVQRFLRSSNQPLYACKLDISKYYASINHDKLKQLLSTKISDHKLLALLGVIIDSTDSGTEHDYLFPPDSPFHTKGRRGIPIGNLTSQLFANIYLHHADIYAKQQLKIRRYVRYMDDILIFHESKSQLIIWQKQMTEFLCDELYLIVNPRKIRIYPTRLGVDFVGYVVYPNFMKLRSSSVRRFKKRQHKQLKKLLTGQTSRTKVIESFDAWSAHASHAKTHHLVNKLKSKQDEYLFVHDVIKYARKHGCITPKPPVQLSFFDEV